MKRCKWCNTNIEDDAIICPHCKAEQSSSENNVQINHVEKFLEKHPNKTRDNISKTFKKQNIIQKDENYIYQIANDIREIKNIVIIFFILYMLGSLIIVVNLI